jgi:hypothetical protein
VKPQAVQKQLTEQGSLKNSFRCEERPQGQFASRNSQRSIEHLAGEIDLYDQSISWSVVIFLKVHRLLWYGGHSTEEKANGELPDKRAGGTGKFGVTNARSDDVTR